jgi:protein TonB
MRVVGRAPEFPPAATSAGLDRGYVILSYSVTARGTTTDIAVVESSSELFEAAAIDAVQRYMYIPRMEQGQPVRRDNIKLRVDFSSP